MTEKKDYYSIGNVERDTGIGRDTLRIWERRYGFPKPVRNDKGERAYSELQLRQLQRVRRLLDQGLRPGKILPVQEEVLDQLEAEQISSTTASCDKSVAAMIQAIRSADANQLGELLQSRYEQQGMQTFVLKTIAPLLTAVGELWASGQLQVFQEHFLSTQLTSFLNTKIALLQDSSTEPGFLLATLPSEEHSLGLLMVKALLVSRGMGAVSLGAQVPMDQIVKATEQFQVDYVGITFSGAYLYKQIRADLLELRELLPKQVGIWVGGEGVRRLRKLPMGIKKFNSLDDLPLRV